MVVVLVKCNYYNQLKIKLFFNLYNQLVFQLTQYVSTSLNLNLLNPIGCHNTVVPSAVQSVIPYLFGKRLWTEFKINFLHPRPLGYDEQKTSNSIEPYKNRSLSWSDGRAKDVGKWGVRVQLPERIGETECKLKVSAISAESGQIQTSLPQNTCRPSSRTQSSANLFEY